MSSANLRQLAGRRRALELNALVVHTLASQRAVLVKDIGHAARHAGGKILPDLAQDERHDRPSCTRSRGCRTPSTTTVAPELRTPKALTGTGR